MNKHVIYFYSMSKPLNSKPLILDNFLPGQTKMTTKNTSTALNTTRLILMYKVGQGVRVQTIKSKNGSIQQSRQHM